MMDPNETVYPMGDTRSRLSGLATLFRKVTGALDGLIRVYALVLAVVLTSLVFLQVIFRYALSSGLPWVNELSQYLAIWMVLPLAAALIGSDDHIRISVFVDRLSTRAVHRIAVIETLAVIAFGSAFAYAGIIYAFESGFRSVSPSLGVDMFYIYVILPVSGVLFVVFGLKRLLELLEEGADAIATGDVVDVEDGGP